MYFCDISANIHFHKMIFQPDILLTHTYPLSTSHFSYECLMHNQGYTTMDKNACTAQPTSSVGVMRYLNQFQLSLQKIIIRYTSLHILLMTHLIFHRKLGQEVFSHKARERVHVGPEKELISHVRVVS